MRSFGLATISRPPSFKTVAGVAATYGASGGSTPGNVAQGGSITVDPNTGNLIRAGYRFLGWNTRANGTGTSYEGGETPTLPVGTVL